MGNHSTSYYYVVNFVYTYIPSPLTEPTVVPATRFRYTPHLTLLFIKSKLYHEEVNAGVIIVGIIYNKLANLTTKIILSNGITNNVVVVIAAI